MSAAAGAMKEEDSVVGVARGVAVGFAKSEVVEVELCDGFAVFEVEVGNVIGAVLSWPFAGSGLRVGGNRRGCKERDEHEAGDHDEVSP